MALRAHIFAPFAATDDGEKPQTVAVSGTAQNVDIGESNRYGVIRMTIQDASGAVCYYRAKKTATTAATTGPGTAATVGEQLIPGQYIDLDMCGNRYIDILRVGGSSDSTLIWRVLFKTKT